MDSLVFKISWRVIAYPALAYAIISLILFYLYVHPRKYISGVKPSDSGVMFEDVSLTTADGLKLAGWFIPNKNSKKAVIICHGYPMDKGDVYGMTSFMGKDFNLLLFDFRGLGGSGGFFSSGGTKETADIDAAIAFLADRGFKKVGLFGFSMGAATILMSKNPAVAVRVADAPFADIDGELDYVFKGYGALRRPLIWLMKYWSFIFLGANMDRVSPLNRITELTQPVLLIHGDKDTQVPVESSLRLKAANPRAELWVINGANHGETLAIAGNSYENRVVDFFQKNL
ncbi:MAG: alpha/beta fold hydrolase [Elusimicrobiota bacterium]